jgi:hypothetical protein
MSTYGGACAINTKNKHPILYQLVDKFSLNRPDKKECYYLTLPRVTFTVLIPPVIMLEAVTLTKTYPFIAPSFIPKL